MNTHRNLTPFEAPEPRRRSRLSRLALPLAAVAAGAAAVAAVAIAATRSHTSTVVVTSPPSISSATGGGQASTGTYPSMSGSGDPMSGAGYPMSGSGYPLASMSACASDLSKLASCLGRQLAGNGQQTVSLQRAEALANEIPAGAQAERATGTLRFTTGTVQFVLVASPPNADMKFRAAGINDPTIEVPAGAQITIQFINADNDEAHMWLLQAGDSGPADFGGGSSGDAHIAAAPPLGDPTSAGQPAETFSFHAPAPGNYHYSCPFPGHAAMGMYGHLVVEQA